MLAFKVCGLALGEIAPAVCGLALSRIAPRVCELALGEIAATLIHCGQIDLIKIQSLIKIHHLAQFPFT